MLSGYDPSQPLYVIGRGIGADEIAHWIYQTESVDVLRATTEEFENLAPGTQCIIGFWNMDYRRWFIDHTKNFHRKWISYVHPRAWVTDLDRIGQGTVILGMAHLCYGVQLGDFCLIGEFCNVGHGTRLGRNVVMTPNNIIAGSTVVGDDVLFLQCCSIRDKIQIANNITFSMNSIVTKNVLESGHYIHNRKVSEIKISPT